MKLSLGTVQFGLDYGVSNSAGKTSAEEVKRILASATKAGIDTLDTAPVYGSSEEVLGQAGLSNWNVVSKVPPFPTSNLSDGSEHVQRHIYESLDRLKIDRLDGLLLHRAEDLLSPQGKNIATGMQKAKANGLVNKIGCSIYAPDSLPEIISIMPCDLIQAPLNVIDQRLISSGWLSRLAEDKTEVHIRSVFLQGLLLMESAKRPRAFDKWQNILQRWDQATGGDREHAIELCLGFAKGLSHVSRVVIGVETESHLQQIMSIWDKATTFDASGFAANDPQLLNPSNWNLI